MRQDSDLEIHSNESRSVRGESLPYMESRKLESLSLTRQRANWLQECLTQDTLMSGGSLRMVLQFSTRKLYSEQSSSSVVNRSAYHLSIYFNSTWSRTVGSSGYSCTQWALQDKGTCSQRVSRIIKLSTARPYESLTAAPNPASPVELKMVPSTLHFHRPRCGVCHLSILLWKNNQYARCLSLN